VHVLFHTAVLIELRAHVLHLTTVVDLIQEKIVHVHLTTIVDLIQKRLVHVRRSAAPLTRFGDRAEVLLVALSTSFVPCPIIINSRLR
jgi:hypothetical protein